MKKPKFLISALILSALSLSLLAPIPVRADTPGERRTKICQDTTVIDVGSDCNESGGGIWGVVNIVLRIMTYAVGVLAVIGMVIAGIMYITSSDGKGDSPGGVKAAKTMIFNIVIGLAIYAVLFALLEWLIPGGIM